MEHILEEELEEFGADFVVLDDLGDWVEYKGVEFFWYGRVSVNFPSNFLGDVLPGCNFPGHEKVDWEIGDESSELELDASS